jgi:hypothetical protein
MKELFQFLHNKGVDLKFNLKIINHIPLTKEDLIVHGNVHLHRSKDIILPDNLTIYGDLLLYRSQIEELPENLTVNSLDLEYTFITKIPDSTIIRDTLEIQNSYITDIPENILERINCIFVDDEDFDRFIRKYKKYLDKFEPI